MAIDPTIQIPVIAVPVSPKLCWVVPFRTNAGAATETLVAGAVIYDTRDPVSLNDCLARLFSQMGLDPNHQGLS